jgi:hypothetical protein
MQRLVRGMGQLGWKGQQTPLIVLCALDTYSFLVVALLPALLLPDYCV